MFFFSPVPFSCSVRSQHQHVDYDYEADHHIHTAKVSCTVRRVDFPIFSCSNDVFAKVLAAYLHGITFMQNVGVF